MGPFATNFAGRYKQALDEELRKSFEGEEGLLQNMLRYQLGWVDEHGTTLSGPSGELVHPVLCLLSCEVLLGDYGPALPAAAAVELVHNYSLIHEDVQAGSPNRGQRPSIWWVWGPGQAINAGDGMHALARLALMRLQDRGVPVTTVLKATSLLDSACLRMCEGQHLDLAFQEKLDVGVKSYIKMAAGKTGALTSCAMGLGALAAAAEDPIVSALAEWGKYLGIAYQIKCDIDDLLMCSGEGAPSDNVLNKKKLLPIVYALETGDLPTKRQLGTIYFKRVLEPGDAQQVIVLLNERSAIEYAEGQVKEYSRMAAESLDGVDIPGHGKGQLEQLSQHVLATEGH